MGDEDKMEAQLISELPEQRNLSAELKHILATFVDNMSDGIVVTDLNGQIIYVNKSTERNTGYSSHELIGRSPDIFNGEKDAETIQKEITVTMQRSEKWCGEILQKRKDGSTYLAEFDIFPVLDNEGTPLAWSSIQRDITKRRQAEKALLESEVKYRTLVEQIPAITYVAAINEASTTLYVSPQFEKLLGFTSQADYKVDSNIWRRQLHPEDRERILADVARCYANNEKFVSEYRMFASDERVLWFRDEAEVILDKNTQQPICFHGVMFDITERKRMEKALKEGERSYRLLAENITDVIWVMDLNLRPKYISPSIKSILGYSVEEAMAGGLKKILTAPNDVIVKAFTEELAVEEMENMDLNRSRTMDLECIRKDGSIVWIEAKVNFLRNPDGRPVEILGVARDITQRKRAEEALEVERERLFSVLDGLPVFVYLQAPDYSIRFSNQYFWDIFGKPGERPCYEILNGRNQPCKECRTFLVFKTKCTQNWEWTYNNGRTYHTNVYPFSDIDGSSLALVLGIDITERKQAEEVKRSSMDRFQKIFNASPSLLSIRSIRDDKFTDVNESWLNHMGYRREEVIGNTPEMLNFDVDPLIGTKRRKRSKEGSIRNVELRYRRKSGEELVGLTSTDIIDIADEKSILSEIRDITELKRLENEMARLERLNLVAEMAAGIGHEIRNPMTAVRGFLQMLKNKEECSKYKNYFNLMIEELDRGKLHYYGLPFLGKKQAIGFGGA